ncbi:MAG: hypothetical protein ACRENL_11380 [Candidatus Dormibacteria bacterium]
MPIALPPVGSLPLPPTYQLLINGVDLTANLEQHTWSITQQFSRQGGTATFYLVDQRNGNTPTFVPQALQTISLRDLTLNRLLFNGLVTTPRIRRTLGPSATYWQLDCRDWTYIADTTVVAGDFVGLTADQILKILITQQTQGLIVGTVDAAPTINRYQVNYLQLSTAAKNLARLASQASDYGWFVDENLAMQFFSEAQAAAPVATLTDQLTALPTTLIGGYGYSNFDYAWDGTNVRSACIVRGSTYPGNRTDTWHGDGATTQWVLSFPLNTGGGTPTLSVGGVPTPLWIAQVSSGTQPAAGYQLVQSQAGPWVLQVYGGRAAPPVGAGLSLSYPYQAPVVARADALAFQAQYASLPNRGVFAMHVTDSTLVTLTAAQQRAIAELTQYAQIPERVTLTTSEGFGGHIRGGDQFSFLSLIVPDSKNSFTVPLSATMIALSVTIRGRQSGYRTYDLQAQRTA